MQRGSPDQRGRRYLVTGASGFAGCYLVDALLERRESIVGLSRGGIWPAPWQHLGRHVELHACDLSEADGLVDLLRAVGPTHLFHLAGSSHAGESVRQPEIAWRDNLQATECLFAAVVQSGLRPRIVQVSTGLVYGPCHDPSARLDESSPLCPDSPYARSKAAADEVSHRYFREHGLAIVHARPFNHTGPMQSSRFAIPAFARQLAAIAAGTIPPVLETGNLAVLRDLSDVRDVVDAYIRLMEYGVAGEVYNIGSGESTPLRQVVDRLIELSGRRVEVRPRADLFRPGEPACIRVDADKLRRQTGWKPRHSLEQTLADTLAAWRQRGLDDGSQE